MVVTYSVQGWTNRKELADKSQYEMSFDRAQQFFNALLTSCEMVMFREETVLYNGWSISKPIACFERG